MSSFVLPTFPPGSPARFSFVPKIAVTLALLVLADWLSSAGFYWLGRNTVGAQAGLFALLWLAAILHGLWPLNMT